jgi:hypothetical protein
MSPKLIGYWVVTSLFAFALTGSGVADLVLVEDIVKAMDHLGYPLALPRILGFWKVAGVLAVLVPGMPLLKEWAYAGFFFALTGAAASHLAIGDGLGEAAPPLVLATLGGLSWALRPAGRALPGANPLGA